MKRVTVDNIFFLALIFIILAITYLAIYGFGLDWFEFTYLSVLACCSGQ